MVHTVYFFVREDGLQNAKHRFPTVFCIWRLLFICRGVALLPLSATGGGRQATPTDCTNHYIFTVGHNMFFYITNCLHEQGKAARRITNKKVGKQKFCIENLLPDFNF